ncbi:MAG: response regulator [Bacteroidia bacterium]|nr:response regulator [Bacteroidia bacterium]
MTSLTNQNPLHVLLAEDDAMNIIVVSKFLQRWGISCDVARNGMEAVDKAKEKKYDVILMDMFMPMMNGTEAARQIRTFDEAVRIFALTADSSDEMKQQAIESGITDFVTKPFNPEELHHKLDNLK